MVNQHSAAERRHYQFRRATERLAGVGMVLCTAVTVFFLFMILGYVITTARRRSTGTFSPLCPCLPARLVAVLPMR